MVANPTRGSTCRARMIRTSSGSNARESAISGAAMSAMLHPWRHAASGRRKLDRMRKWLPLTAVCLGTFMLLVDVTIVNVALPDMAADLHTSLGALQWVVDGYALALAALLLGIGSLA